MLVYIYALILPLWRALSTTLPKLAIAGDYNRLYYRPTT